MRSYSCQLLMINTLPIYKYNLWPEDRLFLPQLTHQPCIHRNLSLSQEPWNIRRINLLFKIVILVYDIHRGVLQYDKCSYRFPLITLRVANVYRPDEPKRAFQIVWIYRLVAIGRF